MRNSIFLLALLAINQVAMAQGIYTQIDYPGALQTQSFGIDAAGDIAGFYLMGDTYHGFLLSGGVFTSVDYAGDQDTYLYDINDIGEVVGFAAGPNVSFVYDVPTQTISAPIGFPGAVQTVSPAINNAGGVAGFFYVSNQMGTQGFHLTSSTYKELRYPGATQTYIFGITTSGELAGYAFIGKTRSYINFTFNRGKFSQVTIPNASGAEVFGISSTGTALVGRYQSSANVYSGFLYQNGTMTTLQFPGSNNTTATSVNGSDEVTGFFADSNGMTHGFVWSSATQVEK